MLLLDYDGTLAPFRENRMEAEPAPGLRELVDEIAALPGSRVVIVTGRPAEEILLLLRPREPLEIWACHGREHRASDGTMTYHGVTEENRAALRAAGDDIRRTGLVGEDRIDEKTGCLAIHWRGMEQRSDEISKTARQLWTPRLAAEGLQILEFNGGIELCVPGRTKGDAINALLQDINTAELPVAFLGDDLTDEDGFQALGSRGLSVLVKDEPRQTAADMRITPGEIAGFLRQWRDALT